LVRPVPQVEPIQILPVSAPNTLYDVDVTPVPLHEQNTELTMEKKWERAKELRAEKLRLRMDNEDVVFSLDHAIKMPMETQSCKSIDMVSNLFNLDFSKTGDSEFKWKIDKGESRQSWEEGNFNDHIFVTKKGEVLSVDKKRERKYLKVRMRQDRPVIQ